MRLSLALVLSAMTGTAAAQSPTRTQPLTPAALDSLIHARMTDVGLMGLGAMVLVDGEVRWSKAYGFRDARRQHPFTLDTPVSVGSIAKPFTGVAMMQLVAEGRLALDEDVSRYLPFRVRNPHAPEVPITLRMLATHTSSITDRWEVYRDAYHFGGDSPEPLAAFLASYVAPGGAQYAESNYLKKVPGSTREYSNIGAALAGHIVERVSGERLDRRVAGGIFAPLGMRNSGWFLRDLDPARLSTLFVAQDGRPIPIPHYGMTTYPDGGVRTSVNDLSRFFRALLAGGAVEGNRILPAREAGEMLRFQFSGPAFPEGYGEGEGNSGLFWRTKFNGQRIGHGGNDPGVQAEMLASLDRRVAVILLCNTSASGEDGRAFGDIFSALWALGEGMRR